MAINNLPERFHDTDLHPCDGWRPFLFGNRGDFAYDRFSIRSDCPLHLRITDAFCAGDEFIVYDWNRRLGVVRGPGCDEGEDVWRLCKRPLTEAEEAWKCDRFASRQFLLSPGHHRITIKSFNAPIGAGKAFIKVQHITRPCNHAAVQHPDESHCHGRFTFVSKPVLHTEAARVCDQLGLRLAAVTKDTFDEAAQLIFKDAGANAKAWIASYNGDSYGDNCLAFSVASGLPSGNINLSECSVPIPVLCSRR